MKAPIRLLALVLLAAPTPAAANTCKVRVVRAPDEVRPVIEAWVRAEPSCRGDLEVRVIPTEGGYYLYARDPAGRVRERLVPDAQAVGVLVASWIADDAMPAAPAAIPIAPPRSVLLRESNEPTAPRAQMSGISFTLGAITSLAKGYGLRGEVELQRSGWLVYGAGSIGRSGMLYDVGGGDAVELYPNDVRVAAGVGRAWGGQRWQVRARIGATHVTWSGDFGDTMPVSTTFDGVETGLRMSRRINERWSFVGGLDVTRFVSQESAADALSVVGPAFEVGALAGFDVRL